MTWRLALATVTLVTGSGCKQAVPPAQPISCFDRFNDSTIGQLLDRWSANERKGELVGVKVAFEVSAPSRPVKSLEALLARFGADNEIAVAKEGTHLRIRMAPSTLHLTSSGLKSALENACAVASKNHAQIVRWDYILPQVSLDDGLFRYNPPS